MDGNLIFGYPNEWKNFQNRNHLFISRFKNLTDALDAAYVREVTTNEPAERAILFLGRLSIEDFMEILCLAANGYGFGAMKLLRGLYERAVTASYLSNHPEEAPAFLDWRYVSRHKAISAYVAGGTRDERWIDKANNARGQYNKIKNQYEVDDCKRCGTKRINHTWSKLDFVSMAKQTGELGKLLAQAYYEPLNHAHSTAEALMMRLELTSAGAIGFKPGAQPEDADRALQLAHAILISLIEVQQKYFGLDGLAEKVVLCVNDFAEIWSDRLLAVDPS